MALPFLPSSIDFRRKTGVVTAMREREKTHLTPLVLVMSGMSIRFSVLYIQEFLLDTHPLKVDVTSSSFTSLSKELQYEVLNELKGKRKQNSWAVMHQMPKKAEDFSGFQFQRLMRRKQIQRKLETVSQEISEDAAAR